MVNSNKFLNLQSTTIYVYIENKSETLGAELEMMKCSFIDKTIDILSMAI